LLFLQSLLPRVAGKLDVAAISDVIDIESDNTFVRTIYAGNAVLRVQSTDPLKIVTVRGTAFAASSNSGGSASTETGMCYLVHLLYQLSFSAPKIDVVNDKSSWVSQELSKSDRPELTSAGKVVSGGL